MKEQSFAQKLNIVIKEQWISKRTELQEREALQYETILELDALNRTYPIYIC